MEQIFNSEFYEKLHTLRMSIALNIASGQAGGRKSFRHDELDLKYVIKPHRDPGLLIPFLDAMQIDLEERE